MRDFRRIRRLALLFGVACVAIAAGPSTVRINGIAYGPSETISGIWFTNFENSRFLECAPGKCRSASSRDWASIACADRTCDLLDRGARQITRSKVEDSPEGTFRIRFVGRRGLLRHKSRYLGDGERDVWIDRLLEMKRSPREP